MNFFASSLERGGSSVLVRDDADRVLRYQDILESLPLGEANGKRLWMIMASNQVPSIRAYLRCVVHGDVALLVDANAAGISVSNLIERFDPDVIVDPEGEATFRRTRGGELYSELALLMPTSGSSGQVKLVRLTAAQLESNARAIAAYLCLNAGERPYLHLPLHYSFGLSILHSHLVAGASVELTQQSVIDPGFWYRASAARVTSISGVPFHFEAMLKLRFDRNELPALKMLTQAGGRLERETTQRIAKICGNNGWSFFVMYGQTEAGPRISYLPPDKVQMRPRSIGIPIPGVSIKLFDDSGAEISEPETEGEVVVESPSVMLGYAEERADLALGDEQKGHLQTGDLGYRDNEGYYFIAGRKDRQIKLQGNRINLEWVEEELKASLVDACAVGKDDRLWIVTEDTTAANKARKIMRTRFRFPLQNVKIVDLPQVPRTASGKVQYSELLDFLNTERLVR